MRSQVDIVVYPNSDEVVCISYARLPKLPNMSGSSEPTIRTGLSEFRRKAHEIIPSMLIDCHNSVHLTPNVLYADDNEFERIQREAMVVVFSKLVGKNDNTMQVRSLYPQSDRYDIREPLTQEIVQSVMMQHFAEKFGTSIKNPFAS